MKTVLCFALCVLTASAAFAQSPVLPVGTRIRVRVNEAERQKESRYHRGLVLRGEVTAVSGDTLYLRPTPRTGVLAVPMTSVQTMFRSRGVAPRFASGVGGAIAGAIAGLLYVELDYRWGERPTRTRGEANRIGAGVGAAVHGTLGFAFPVERWRRVRIER